MPLAGNSTSTFALALILAGCGSAGTPPVGLPAPSSGMGGAPYTSVFPPIPEAVGTLELSVVYPPPDAVLDVDTTFIFGSTGTGDARLWVNGEEVMVWPNGGWLAWTIPIAEDTTVGFAIRAVRGADTVEAIHRAIRLPRFHPPDGRLWVDTTSFRPAGRIWWPVGEALPLRVRAVPGASVSFRMPGGRPVPLSEAEAYEPIPDGIRDFDRDVRNLIRRPVRGLYEARYFGPGLGPTSRIPLGGDEGEDDDDRPSLVVVIEGDTLIVPWPIELHRVTGPGNPIRIDDDPGGTGTGDGITPGRAAVGASYHWFLPKGTVVVPTARLEGNLRVALGGGQDAWIGLGEAVHDEALVAASPARVGSLTLSPGTGSTTIRIPVGRRIPFRVSEETNRISLTLYRAVGDVNWTRYGPGGVGQLVKEVHWDQQPGDLVVITFDLERPLWGYRVRWEATDLLLEVRQPPPVERGRPLRGRTIVVDAGHPPGGAKGPTGFREDEANLAIARRLATRLRAAGATVVETRVGNDTILIGRRVREVESSDADLLVSIHNNALPDGVNPFTNYGTSTFYNHSQSLLLARTVQESLVRALRLPDLGVARADLAMVRVTWMPAILTEGLFLLHPDQEAFLRTEEGQERYARAVEEGLTRFFRDLAGGGR